ncbi:69_t:CDS:10, partial [Entrophospora sp. SA101]
MSIYKKDNFYLKSDGRSLDGTKFNCYLVGVAGGSASGKTSVSQRIIENLNVPWAFLLSMDSYYKILTPEQKVNAFNNNHNFDHPDSCDFDLLYENLKDLKEGKRVEIPIYDFKTHSRLPQSTTFYGANVIIFEGVFALYDQRIIFVDTDADLRLIRRINRDIKERGRDIEGILQIIPRGRENEVAIDLITKHIQRQLNEHKYNFRWDIAKKDCGKDLPNNVILLDQTRQLKCMHTIIRNQETQRDDFIFYSERLATLLVERGLSEFCFKEHKVITPLNIPYVGKIWEQKLCGVSILRAGGTMETGLRRVVKDSLIGKILIQSDPKTGEPSLHFVKLPNKINECSVLLMDAQIATGAAALMAIRVLLDHSVPEDKIVFLSFIATPLALHVISNAFPKVKVCTSMIDQKLDAETLFIEPGMGNFG